MTVERLSIGVAGVSGSRFTTHELHRGIKEHFAIVWVEYGRSEFWAHGRFWSSDADAISLKRPGDVHRDLRREGVSRFQVILLDAALVEAACDGEPPKRLAHSHLEPGDPRGAPFRRLHRAIAAHREPAELEHASAEALGALACELRGKDEDDPRGRWARTVRRAVELIEARFSEPLNLDAIAAHAGLDKFRLSRAFREAVGMPPHEYRTHLRIARAKRLLVEGMPAREVATEVGFYDQSQLSHHFMRIVGTTPGRWTRTR